MIWKLVRWLLVHLMWPALFLLAGWYLGAKNGAPDLLIRATDGAIARAQAIAAPLIGQGADVAVDAAGDAATAAGDYVAGSVQDILEDVAEVPDETDNASDTDEAEEDEQETASKPVEDTSAASQPKTEPAPALATKTQAPTGGIVVCDTSISNPPRGGKGGDTIGAADETVRYKGVDLLLMPATNACLSSGYGTRNGRLHKGVDYFSDTGGVVIAAADGIIREKASRNDYGNMIVIDHGNDVYTRYAHLAGFASGVREGANVRKGQELGPIGSTGASTIVHLHYEVLTGDYAAAGSFGLEIKDPYKL